MTDMKGARVKPMKKQERIDLINYGMVNKEICRCYFSYDPAYFYCYPNETEKKTRLVIETLIDGMVYYYPITLDKVEANNRYFYDVVLTRLGSMSPDQPVEDVLTSFVIATTNWKDNMNDVEI